MHSVYATDVSSQVACHAIKAMGKITLRMPSKANMCIDKLLSLLTLHIEYITSKVVVVMTG